MNLSIFFNVLIFALKITARVFLSINLMSTLDFLEQELFIFTNLKYEATNHDTKKQIQKVSTKRYLIIITYYRKKFILLVKAF